MFSVIIPLYNKSPWIGKCLQSVFNQSLKDFEVIVIDDGSTDDGLHKTEQFVQKSQITIIQQPNSGVAKARNNAVNHAKYDYLAFLDADDWWDKHFLEEMKTLIELCPEARLFGSNYFYVKAGKSRLEDKGFPTSFTAGYINYITTYSSSFIVPFNCSFVIVRKDAFLSEGGFKPSLKMGEDFDMWIKLALKYKVAYINKPLAYSNQDVTINQRALGFCKHWKTSEHYIFNLEFLKEEEKKNDELKRLLDGLRMRSLIPFWINGWHTEDVKRIITRIDFRSQPSYYNRIYRWPRFMIKLWFHFLSLGSFIKQRIKGIGN